MMPITNAAENPCSVSPPKTSSADHHQQGHQLGHQGSRQRLVDGLVDHLRDREFARVARALADAVEDDDGIVKRIADDRQDGRDRRQVESDLGHREETDHADRVVQHREDRAQRELEVKRNST